MKNRRSFSFLTSFVGMLILAALVPVSGYAGISSMHQQETTVKRDAAAENIQVAQSSRVPRTHGPASKQIVEFATNENPGTIIISNDDRTLHLVLANGKAARYNISVGRDGFIWNGVSRVGRKTVWPDWRPPGEMRKRQPSLPEFVPAGPFNPLGARAIYLFQNGRDTLYRIHGTNDSSSIGGYETSGCFRLSNKDVLELYSNVKVGSKVIVK